MLKLKVSLALTEGDAPANLQMTQVDFEGDTVDELKWNLVNYFAEVAAFHKHPNDTVKALEEFNVLKSKWI